MCKLAAFVNLSSKSIPKPTMDKIAKVGRHLAYINSYGNRDGSGVMQMDDKGEMYYVKRGLPSPDFLQLDSSKGTVEIASDTKFWAFHTRYGTVGGVSDKNAHPYLHGSILLMQNGTSYYGYYDLVPGKTPPNYVETDSEHVCWSISEQGKESTFKKYSGAGVFMWLDGDSKTLNISKNSERTLFSAKLIGHDAYFITTDSGALKYAANRAGLMLDEEVPFPENCLITYTLDGNIIRDNNVHVEEEFSYSYLDYDSTVTGASAEHKDKAISSKSHLTTTCSCCEYVIKNTERKHKVQGTADDYVCETCYEYVFGF